MSTVSQTDATNKSTQTFLTALVLNGAIAAIEIGLFLFIRNRFRKIYEPRSYLPSKLS